MSHITKIDLEVTNLDALEKALATIDPALELKRGQTTFRWFGQYMGDSRVPAGMDPANYGKCAHAIGFKEGDPRHGTAYEIGLAEIPGKTGYQIVLDNFCGGMGLCPVVGKNAEKVAVAYARERARGTLALQGYVVKETVKEDGTIRLIATRPGR